MRTTLDAACSSRNTHVQCVSVTQNEQWARAWTRTIGRNVRLAREATAGRPKMSAQALSDRCSELGYEIPRNAITNLENGRKEVVSVQEIAVLALALEVAPVSLLYPLTADVEIAPGVVRHPFHAVQWFAGVWAPRSPSEILPNDRLPAPELTLLRDYVDRVREETRYRAQIEALKGVENADEVRRLAQEGLARATDQVKIVSDLLAHHGIAKPDLGGPAGEVQREDEKR